MASDPNKYSKNAKINPESYLSVLLASLRMGLMLVGIFGLTYELFRDHGWLYMALGDIIDSTTNMLLAVIVFLGLWLLNLWFSRPQKAHANGSGDILMYAMMAVGVYFIYRFFTMDAFQL